MRMASAIVVLTVAVLLFGCGGAATGPEVEAVTDAMDCAEVAAVIDAAIERGQRFVAGQETDVLLAGDLVFALSGAEERPECVGADVRSRAGGLRATLNGITG